MYFLSYDFLNHIFFFLAYFTVRIQYIIHKHKMCHSTIYVISKATSQL